AGTAAAAAAGTTRQYKVRFSADAFVGSSVTANGTNSLSLGPFRKSSLTQARLKSFGPVCAANAASVSLESACASFFTASSVFLSVCAKTPTERTTNANQTATTRRRAICLLSLGRTQ